ncbi:hypothetical protein QC763_609460 [Podospora pseudopauciseta]|uniref:FAD/NAD(P)-binding domain-containing protein n=1 Tax=Podospora pseudopauciseta TaxID=2093780 RepID=A0ABR0H678_9PEZI|nr:hypothetical protein QC763_609460 [Podospora pseudopauciseta]
MAYPPAADLRQKLAEHPLPTVAVTALDPASLTPEETAKIANNVLTAFNKAISTRDITALSNCLFAEQALWKDSLALTYHLRTFSAPAVIAAHLLETTKLRGAHGFGLEFVHFLPVSPTLQFIDCSLSLKTASPAATCTGRMLLLPVEGSGGLEWKIWVLSTRLESLDAHPEDETLLRTPSTLADGGDDVKTDVFIIGGGNGAVTLASRLKALGVESVMADRNANSGDNWALRYDSLKFHVPTAMCDMPYLPYGEDLKGSHLLTRDELANQVRQYVKEFNLNMITSSQIQSTQYDQATRRWTVKLKTPSGLRTVRSKHLVQATGLASQKPRVPDIAGKEIYKGISLHSKEYKNPEVSLQNKGAKSVLIIGSANTAIDILNDCQTAGLDTTILARSPTYVLPVGYVMDPRGFGLFNQLDTETCDRALMSFPTWVECNMAHGLLAMLASQEPDRYKRVAKAGFPVIDSAHPDACLMHNLVERGGGHYVDIGGLEVVAEGNVGVISSVEPVAYMETGLRLSDGKTAEADSIIWCTGFSDLNARDTVFEVLGGENAADGEEKDSNLLGPRDIANRVDATFGVDEEGEIRGLWKRQRGIDNFWFMGGQTQHHRYHSKTVALQIKAELEETIPVFLNSDVQISGIHNQDIAMRPKHHSLASKTPYPPNVPCSLKDTPVHARCAMLQLF